MRGFLFVLFLFLFNFLAVASGLTSLGGAGTILVEIVEVWGAYALAKKITVSRAMNKMEAKAKETGLSNLDYVKSHVPPEAWDDIMQFIDQPKELEKKLSAYWEKNVLNDADVEVIRQYAKLFEKE